MSEFKLLQQSFLGWREWTQQIIIKRSNLMSYMYKKDRNILVNCFKKWAKICRKRNNYKKRRDMFYKKLLIFNYRYILRKYFNAFKKYKTQLITEYYKKEQLNNFIHKKILEKQRELIHAFRKVIWMLQEEKLLIEKIKIPLKKVYFELWMKMFQKSKFDKKFSKKTNDLSDIEQWVEYKKENRIQPKIQDYQEINQQVKQNIQQSDIQQQIQQEPKIQQFQQKKPDIIPISYQTPIKQQYYERDNVKQLDLLNKYLQFKVAELDYKNTLPDAQDTKDLKDEIRETLRKINEIKLIFEKQNIN